MQAWRWWNQSYKRTGLVTRSQSLHKSSLFCLFQLGTQPLGDKLPGQAVALLVPVAGPRGLAEAVEINVVLGSVFLKVWRQKENGYVVGMAEILQSVLGVEQVRYPQIFGKGKPFRRVGIHLGPAGQGYHKKPGPLLSNFILHPQEYPFRHSPGILPGLGSWCPVNRIAETGFVTCRRGMGLIAKMLQRPPFYQKVLGVID